MNTLIFLITLGAEALTIIALVISIALPQRRIWPPYQRHSWRHYYMLALFIVSGAGIILLGILDWDSFIVPSWVRVMIGFPLWLVGNGFALWAIAILGISSTSGGEGALVYRGPYRFSRNPQYVGFILALVGWAVITNSASVLSLSLAGIIPLLLVPFAEESWLLEKYGLPYAEYKRTVPRFIVFKN
jgi:protein-S-isoprenylcysteine O-methyltransferase Ste14